MAGKEVLQMTKTNVMRLLDAAKIPYRAEEYAADENDLNGMHAAEGIGMPPEQIFKTLVAKGERGGYAVFCIPVCCELDLKRRRRPRTTKRSSSSTSRTCWPRPAISAADAAPSA